MSTLVMGPIERVRARAAAFDALGVDHSAGPGEIRDAWRRAAFQEHPDHAGGNDADFAKAKAAYDVLRQDGRAAPAGSDANARDSKPRRPSMKARVVQFPNEQKRACQALLDANIVKAGEASFVDAAGVRERFEQAASSPSAAPKDHIAEAVRCEGRQLTYIVPSSVIAGVNRVALPASVLENARLAKPRIVMFRSRKAGTGEIALPEHIQSNLFPGARCVRLRFQAADPQS